MKSLVVDDKPTVQRLAEKLKSAVARSTVYRLLERHGWRKVVPRPRHPKTDIATHAA
jgi:hypothetical protein